MNVTQVKDLFLSYVDETDEGGPAPNWTTMRRNLLERGYFDFVDFIIRHDDFIFRQEVDITFANTDVYDLASAGSAVRIMGNPAGGLTHGRLWRLINITTLDGNNNPSQVIPSTRRLDALAPFGSPSFQLLRPWFAASFILKGSILQFNIELNQTLRVFYVPSVKFDAALTVGVNWAADGAAQTTYIDNFEVWHDMIALFAARRYVIMDGMQNPMVDNLLKARKMEFGSFLIKSIDADAGSRVQMVY